MKITDCTHTPKTFAKPQANQCMEGDIEMHEFGLRVCLTCGHVGCCEDDPGQHALKHFKESDHQVIASYPADENSFIWCYADNDYLK
jgi:uncharacterized UBP type Zn finger protein